MSARYMKKASTVRYAFDPANPPPLTDAQKARLAALADKPDDQIDVSDIPPLDDSLFDEGVRGLFYRPVKKQLTLRLDADIIEWFKQHAEGGRGYQTRINRALRAYVASQNRRKAG